MKVWREVEQLVVVAAMGRGGEDGTLVSMRREREACYSREWTCVTSPARLRASEQPGMTEKSGVVVKGRAAASTHHTRVSSSVLVRKVEGVSCCMAEERKVSEGLEQYS